MSIQFLQLRRLLQLPKFLQLQFLQVKLPHDSNKTVREIISRSLSFSILLKTYFVTSGNYFLTLIKQSRRDYVALTFFFNCSQNLPALHNASAMIFIRFYITDELISCNFGRNGIFCGAFHNGKTFHGHFCDCIRMAYLN